MAIGLYFALVWRLLRILALEFETVYVHVHEGLRIREPALHWSRFLIQYGALPLVTLFFAALLFRLLRRFGEYHHPLAGLSRSARALIALAAFAVYLAFVVPAGTGFAMWLSVEVFWWIQWYHNIIPTMSTIIYDSPTIFHIMLVLLGLLLVGFSFARPDLASQKPRWRRWVLRGIALLAVVALLPLFTLTGLRASRVFMKPGRAIYEQSCQHCHARARPLYFTKTPVEWERTLTKMKEVEKAPIDEQGKQDVIAFLTGMRSFSDRWTFRTRCQRCHTTSYLSWDLRDPQDWEEIVARHARWSPWYYRKDVRDQVVAYLSGAFGESGATLGFDAETYAEYRRVGQTCMQCHSFSRQADRFRNAAQEQTMQMVRRMNQKMPEPMTDEETTRVAKTWQAMISEPGLVDKLFPHDRPMTWEAQP